MVPDSPTDRCDHMYPTQDQQGGAHQTETRNSEAGMMYEGIVINVIEDESVPAEVEGNVGQPSVGLLGSGLLTAVKPVRSDAEAMMKLNMQKDTSQTQLDVTKQNKEEDGSELPQTVDTDPKQTSEFSQKVETDPKQTSEFSQKVETDLKETSEIQQKVGTGLKETSEFSQAVHTDLKDIQEVKDNNEELQSETKFEDSEDAEDVTELREALTKCLQNSGSIDSESGEGPGGPVTPNRTGGTPNGLRTVSPTHERPGSVVRQQTDLVLGVIEESDEEGEAGGGDKGKDRKDEEKGEEGAGVTREEMLVDGQSERDNSKEGGGMENEEEKGQSETGKDDIEGEVQGEGEGNVDVEEKDCNPSEENEIDKDIEKTDRQTEGIRIEEGTESGHTEGRQEGEQELRDDQPEKTEVCEPVQSEAGDEAVHKGQPADEAGTIETQEPRKQTCEVTQTDVLPTAGTSANSEVSEGDVTKNINVQPITSDETCDKEELVVDEQESPKDPSGTDVHPDEDAFLKSMVLESGFTDGDLSVGQVGVRRLSLSASMSAITMTTPVRPASQMSIALPFDFNKRPPDNAENPTGRRRELGALTRASFFKIQNPHLTTLITDNSQMLIGTQGGNILVLDLPSGAVNQCLCTGPTEDSVMETAIRRELGEDGGDQELGEDGGNQDLSTRPHQGPVTHVSRSHDYRYVVVASRDKTLSLWKMADFGFMGHLQGHTDEVFKACFYRCLPSYIRDPSIMIQIWS